MGIMPAMMMQVIGAAFNPKATALIARMTTPPTSGRATKISNLFNALDAAGITSLLDCLQIYYAEAVDQAVLNWISTSYTASIIGTASFSALSGITTPGTTGNYIDTGFSPSVAPLYTQNNNGFFYWNNRTATEGNSILGFPTTTTTFSLFTRSTTNALSYRANSTTQISSGTTVTDASGLVSVNRTSASATEAFKNGASLVTGSATSVALTNENVLIGRRGTGYQAGNAGAFGGGASLTSTQQAQLYTALQTYMT